MSAVVRRARALGCALLALTACSTETEPLTQIVVVVDTDFTGLTRFEAEIEGFEEPHTLDVDLEDSPLPHRFSLVHDGGELGPIAVTVSAYTDGDEPILVEPRSGMFFKLGQTQLLKIDLLAVCVGLCEEGQACIYPGECVSPEDAAVLTPWTGPPGGLDVGGPLDGGMDSGMHPMPDGSMDEGGVGKDAMPDGEDKDPDAAVEPDGEVEEPDADVEPDATTDAGEDAIVPDPTWPYVPSNVEPEDGVLAELERKDVALDCAGTATIDSSDPPSATGFCEVTPELAVVEQLGGGEVLAVVMSSLTITATSTLKLIGSRPIVLVVEGDASIAGTIDASADYAVGGPGAGQSCAGSTGSNGGDAPTTSNGAYGASGGGGGGFGSAGMASGASGNTAAAQGGAVSGDATLVPLRGGCNGGAGGRGDNATSAAAGGGGGGAVQLSIAGTLSLSGQIHAGGGGGAPGVNVQGGGGGGGSGGAVLIEAETLAIAVGAVIAVNGGAGGGGQPTVSNMLTSTPGQDAAASKTPATPGAGTGTGGAGGRGAALDGVPESGEVAANSGTACPSVLFCNWGGGGGGGGGIGRVRIRDAGTCVLPGTYSPAPIVECASCGACPAQPSFTCSPLSSGTGLYSLCSTSADWASARMQCQSVGLDLVKIDDEVENDFLLDHIAGATWIGASDAVEEDWRWVADNTQFWSGDEDGDPVGGAFNDWKGNDEPNGSGDCARIADDGWLDTDCGDTLPFLCEQP